MYTGAIIGYLTWPAMIIVSYFIIKYAVKNMKEK